MSDSNTNPTTEGEKSEVDATTEKVEAEATPAAKKEAEKTYTQAEFDKELQEKVAASVKDRLGRDANARKKLQEDAEKALQDKSTLEKEVEDLQGELVTWKDKAAKLELAMSEGVPFELVNALKGETPEELKAALAAVRASQPKGSTNTLFEGKSYATQQDVHKADLDALKNIRF